MYAFSPAEVARPDPGERFEHDPAWHRRATAARRHERAAGYPGPRASRHRALLGRLRRPAHRPPAAGHPAAHGQGGRLGVDPRRRPGVQAAELDEPAVPAGGGARACGGWSTRPARSCGSPWRRSSTTPSHELGRRPGPGQGRRRGAPAGAAGRAPDDPRRGLHAGPAGVHDRDRAGRPALPGRRPARTVAVEVKRRGEIDGVEQLTRYLELLDRDPLLAPVAGVFAAQEIKPQARVLASDRGIRCVVVDYDALRGIERDDLTPLLTVVQPVDHEVGRS